MFKTLNEDDVLTHDTGIVMDEQQIAFMEDPANWTEDNVRWMASILSGLLLSVNADTEAAIQFVSTAFTTLNLVEDDMVNTAMREAKSDALEAMKNLANSCVMRVNRYRRERITPELLEELMKAMMSPGRSSGPLH